MLHCGRDAVFAVGLSETKRSKRQQDGSVSARLQGSFILFKVKNHFHSLLKSQYTLQPAAFTPGTFQENHLATSRKAEILHKALDKDEETSETLETWETCVEMETPRDFTGALWCFHYAPV